MKIVKIAHHCCVRVQKQASALLDKGHKVHLISNRLPFTPEFTTSSHFATASQLRESLRLHKDADIVHLHNEPSWPLMVVKEILPNVPAVLDLHDAMIFRSTDIKYKSAEERLTFDWADGLVFVGEKCRQVINPKQPSCVLPSYVNESYYEFNAWQWIGGVAYEGKLNTPEDKEFMHYCNYVDVCKGFQEAGIPFHVYAPGGDKEVRRKYYESICHLCVPLPFDKLIQIMGCHDWGLCGNLKKYREWQFAMPNKLFEYMAAGIPIIALNCSEVAKFVKKHGVGIVVKNIQEIKDRWDERAKCQKNVFAKRFQFSMERHIHILEELYRKLT